MAEPRPLVGAPGVRKNRRLDEGAPMKTTLARLFARFALLMLAGAGVGTATSALAQAADAIHAVRLQGGERLVLDGTLSHPAWQRAPVFDRFVEKDPVNGGPPPQQTRVQVLFDEQALYVGVRALDTDLSRIRDTLVRADGVFRTQDFVVVYIDAIGSRQSAQWFRVNAAGSTADGMHTAADDNEDFAPDFDWDAAVSRQADGWTAVLRLPFASLRFAEGRQNWRVMVGRRLPRDQFHLVASVPIPRDAPSFIARMQPLLGVTLPERHRFLTVRPSVTLRTARDAEGRRNDADLSLDVKWRPRAELVLDGTLNPDFSQVALDVPQLAGNSRFALSLAEKRPFFFESADLLRSPTEAFYTRSYTAPRWGLRSTWRDASVAGSAFAIDDRGGGIVLLPGAFGTDAVAQPGSRSLAARVKADRGTLQLGGLMAARRYEAGAGENVVLGPDFGWQINDAWRVRGQWLHSRTDAFTGGQQRDGDRAYLRLWRQTDDSEFNLKVDESGAGFRHDTGFVNQVGVRRVEAFASKGWFGVGPFNQFYVNLQTEQVRDLATGQVVKQVVRPGIWSTGASNLAWWLEAFVQSRLRTAPGRPLLEESFIATGLVMSPAPWFPLVDLNLSAGRLADTVADTVRPGLRGNLSARLRPLAARELEPSLGVAWLRNAGRMTYHETAVQWLAVWHIDARQHLRLILQRSALDRLAEPGVTAYSGSGRTSSLTYSWRHPAGTVLYVGASQSRQGAGAGGANGRNDEAFLKLQFDTDRLGSGSP